MAVGGCSPKTFDQACTSRKRKPLIPDICALDEDCPQPKVVIVGAGLAGLSAAHRLITCGINRVVVLEAQDRPGGRIYTKKIEDKFVDLGASLIYGACTGNPIFTLACQEGALKFPMLRTPRHVGTCFESSGRYIKARVFHTALDLFDEIQEMAISKYKKIPPDINLWTFIVKQIEQVVELFPKPDQKDAEKVLYGLTNEMRNILGTELECISLSKYGRMKPYPGGVVAVESGMSRILGPLLRVISENKIKYNKPVVKIYWNQARPGQPRVSVATSDGKIEPADYVIVTVPLGVLKAAHENIFEPPLPEEKVAAIKGLGFGHLSSVVLKYKKPFWLKGEGYFRMCWSKEELSNRSHWTNAINLIEEITTSEDMLHVMISGPEAVQVECLPDCQLVTELTGLIRRFLWNSTVPMPSEIYRTKWMNNSYIGGTTPYLGLKSHEVDIERLSRPIPEIGLHRAPTMFFAGDACAVKQTGLVGARLTGIMEAEKILNFTKCFCGPPPIPSISTCSHI